MSDPAAAPRADSAAAPRAVFDAFLRCPTPDALAELERGLRAYQTDWIRSRAGVDALPADPARSGVLRPKIKLSADERAVLERLADGWSATTADVPRWAWFETRELIRVDPDPSGQGPERLRLAAEGWRCLGRAPV